MLRFAVAASFMVLLIQTSTLFAQPQSSAGSGKPGSAINSETASPFRRNRRVLGYGRLTTNDLIGDRLDRWRTGSVTMSRAWGEDWFGSPPSQFGALLETRVQGQVFAPATLVTANPSDRPHAGALSIGVHTHFSRGATEFAVGADLLVIGPQTRLNDIQTGIHGLTGDPKPSAAVLALQIGNQIRPTLVAEMGRQFRLGRRVDLRPFGEFRLGDESLIRLGADVTIGEVTRGELLSRESVTGQRYRLIYRSGPGFSFVVGADMAFVSQSVYLPENRGFLLTPHRDRVRAGVHWQGDNASVFYGLTYLGREFRAQTEAQVVGSVRIKMSF